MVRESAKMNALFFWLFACANTIAWSLSRYLESVLVHRASSLFLLYVTAEYRRRSPNSSSTTFHWFSIHRLTQFFFQDSVKPVPRLSLDPGHVPAVLEQDESKAL